MKRKLNVKALTSARMSDRVRPPFVATCSLWESSEAIATYAFDDTGAAHPAAIRADRTKPFHHEQAFIRFRPIAVAGSLGGTNPMRAGILG